MRDSVWIDMAQLVRDRSLARRACSSRSAGQEGGVGGLDQTSGGQTPPSPPHPGPRTARVTKAPGALCEQIWKREVQSIQFMGGFSQSEQAGCETGNRSPK